MLALSGDTPQDLTREQIKERGKENRLKNQVCKSKEPPTGDPCQDAKNNLSRLKRCLGLRQNFTNKWYQDGTHDTEIDNTIQAIKNAEEAVKKLCGKQCP